MQRLFINPDFRKPLSEAGLDTFEAFVAKSDDGELIARDKGRTTHRIQLGGGTYYLKSVHKTIVAPSIEALLTLRMPHHYCWREMLQVTALKHHGVGVMEVVAAGESASWGVLNFSFILVAEVKGRSLDELFAQAAPERQLDLLAQLGTLVGHLHSGGFFAPVRMKDVIVDADNHFVMIDRETRKPGARKFSRKNALMGLSRTMWRQTRDGIHWDDQQLHAYLAAYLTQAPAGLGLDEPELKKLMLETAASLAKK